MQSDINSYSKANYITYLQRLGFLSSKDISKKHVIVTFWKYVEKKTFFCLLKLDTSVNESVRSKLLHFLIPTTPVAIKIVSL